MFLYLGPTTVVEVPAQQASSSSNSRLRSLQQQGAEEVVDGWHDIHVFYGEKSGLFNNQHQGGKQLEASQKWFAQVHQDEIDYISKMVIEHMRNAMKLDVPIEIDFGIGPSWYEAH